MFQDRFRIHLCFAKESSKEKKALKKNMGISYANKLSIIKLTLR